MTAKVLVVDDEPQLQSLIGEWLKEVGYSVITASNGRDGLILLRENNPDLVVSDVWMPGMDGYQFSRLVKRASTAAILMMTGVPNEAAVLKEMDVGADDVIIKPFDMDHFLARVDKLLQNRPPAKLYPNQTHQRGVQFPSAATPQQQKNSIPQAGQPVQRPQQNQPQQITPEHRLVNMYRSLSEQDRALLFRMAERLTKG